MPMADELPQLDDHSYDSILAEMRARIPRYTPEWKPAWTDLNDSDPGITMLQVFAWLGEMLAYRMNQVPDQVYLKFLQMLGTELRAAEPAHVQIVFPMQKSASGLTMIVPAGTQVSAESTGGRPLVFEAERALTVIRPALTAVLVGNGGGGYEPVTESNTNLMGFHPFGLSAAVGSALLLGFDDPEGFPDSELTLLLWSANADLRQPVNCGMMPLQPSARITWSAWAGTGWIPVTEIKDATAAFTQTGEIVLRTPGGMSPVVLEPGPDAPARYWLRAQVTASQYERAPAVTGIRTNAMTLTQMETVSDEVLGGSSGRPDQVFRVDSTPVLSGSLEVEVDEGSGFRPWTAVPDFYSSGPADPHYVLNRATGEIRFGDGRRGAIPAANVTNPGANVVARRYSFGGGSAGNVAAGAVHSLRTSLTGIDTGKVTNPVAAYGGRDGETLAEGKQRAPAAIRARTRAVTTEDFEFFATEVASVARARALPRHHPGYPGAQIPGVVTVVVVPDSDDPAPQPSDGTLRTVCGYLDRRRLLTTEVYVVAPTYQNVSVDVEVTVDRNADLAAVQRGIDQTLLDYFHPLRGGDDGRGWPFGGPIRFSRTMHRVFAVPGVASVDRMTITVAGRTAPECRDVMIPAQALVTSTQHRVTLSYWDGGGGA